MKFEKKKLQFGSIWSKLIQTVLCFMAYEFSNLTVKEKTKAIIWISIGSDIN